MASSPRKWSGPASSQQLEAVSLAECRVLTAEGCSNQSPPTEIQPPQIRLQSSQTTIQSSGMIVQSSEMTLQPPQKAPRQPLTPMFSMNALMHWAKKIIRSPFAVLAKGWVSNKLLAICQLLSLAECCLPLINRHQRNFNRGKRQFNRGKSDFNRGKRRFNGGK